MKASKKRIPMSWAEYVAKSGAYESKLVANPYALERDGRRREQGEKQAGGYQAGKQAGRYRVEKGRENAGCESPGKKAGEQP